MKRSLYDYCIETAQPHLLTQWDELKNGRLKPDMVAVGSRQKVWWHCEKGHEWQSAVDSRVYSGRSCPYCANQAVQPGENDISTAAREMAKLWHPTRNGDLKPTDVMPGSHKRLWWRCEKGHEWQAHAYAIKAGGACPYCSGRYPIPGETDLATTHPHLKKLWSDKNKLRPTEVTAGTNKKVLWVCEKGHEWEARVYSVALDGCGCPYCAGKLAIPGETDLATRRPDLMAQWDFEKNARAPTELTVADHEKAWWKCELGHSWQASVYSRTREKSAGCPYCTGRRVLPGFNDLATLKPALAKQWHPTLNGALKPEDVTLGSNKKVWWQCGEGHVWQAFVYARAKAKGTGCPVCAGSVSKRSKRYINLK